MTAPWAASSAACDGGPRSAQIRATATTAPPSPLRASSGPACSPTFHLTPTAARAPGTKDPAAGDERRLHAVISAAGKGRDPEQLQLRAQRPGHLPADDAAERLQRAAGPAAGHPHLVYGLLDVDMAKARRLLTAHDPPSSLTAFVVAGVAPTALTWPPQLLTAGARGRRDARGLGAARASVSTAPRGPGRDVIHLPRCQRSLTLAPLAGPGPGRRGGGSLLSNRITRRTRWRRWT